MLWDDVSSNFVAILKGSDLVTLPLPSPSPLSLVYLSTRGITYLTIITLSGHSIFAQNDLMVVWLHSQVWQSAAATQISTVREENPTKLPALVPLRFVPVLSLGTPPSPRVC
jgi:hypothetical protein